MNEISGIRIILACGIPGQSVTFATALSYTVLLIQFPGMLSQNKHSKHHSKLKSSSQLVTLKTKSQHTKYCLFNECIGCCLYTKRNIHYTLNQVLPQHKTIKRSVYSQRNFILCLIISHMSVYSQPFLQAQWVNLSTWLSCDLFAKWI